MRPRIVTEALCNRILPLAGPYFVEVRPNPKNQTIEADYILYVDLLVKGRQEVHAGTAAINLRNGRVKLLRKAMYVPVNAMRSIANSPFRNSDATDGVVAKKPTRRLSSFELQNRGDAIQMTYNETLDIYEVAARKEVEKKWHGLRIANFEVTELKKLPNGRKVARYVVDTYHDGSLALQKTLRWGRKKITHPGTIVLDPQSREVAVYAEPPQKISLPNVMNLRRAAGLVWRWMKKSVEEIKALSQGGLHDFDDDVDRSD